MKEEIEEPFKVGDNVYYCLGDQGDFTAKSGFIEKIEGEKVFITDQPIPTALEYLQHKHPEPEVIILPLKENYALAHLFTVEFLDALNYKVTSFDGTCGKAKEKKAAGKKTISWNFEGISCDYFGNKLEQPNVAFGVHDDWNTRTTFTGYIRNLDDLKTVLTLTR